MFVTLKSVVFAGLLAASAFAADLFPLQQGNTWTYRESRFGGTFTIEVGEDVAVNGQTYHSLTGYVPGKVLARLDDQNRLVYVDPDSGQEAVLTYFTTPDGGGWWDAPLRMCGEQAQVSEKRGTHESSLGVVNGVLELRYKTLTCADAGDLTEQYAENIGMVRRVTQSFTGPRQFDLIHAKVGGIVVDGLPNASFTVSIDDRPNTESIMATLRLQTNSVSAVKLQYASGQEYDLVLRSSDGRVVWQWSSNKRFIQALHDRTVNGELTFTVAVPRPMTVPEAGALTYTLQAWLTTMGDPPQFSATVPVTIGK